MKNRIRFIVFALFLVLSFIPRSEGSCITIVNGQVTLNCGQLGGCCWNCGFFGFSTRCYFSGSPMNYCNDTGSGCKIIEF